MIETVIKASVSMLVILVAWLFIQSVYRRTLRGGAEGFDEIDGCWSCRGCGGSENDPPCHPPGDATAKES